MPFPTKPPRGGAAASTAIHDNIDGEISAITEKATPVAADLGLLEDSAAANAKKRFQLGNLPFEVPTGTVFPGSPVNGQQFYRTDLDPSPVLFTYDDARAKWLGEIETDGAGRNGSQVTATYLRRFNGMLASATLGCFIPYTITIVGLSMAWNTSATGDLELRRNGVVVATMSWTPAALTASDLTLNAEFASDGIMAFYTNNLSVSITSPQAMVWYRRHAT